MKTLTTLAAILVLTGTLFAQGMGHRRQLYDASTVTTFTGVLSKVDSIATPRGNAYILRYTVKDTSGNISVVVGPTFYLDQQSVTFNAGDTVTVTGSKVQFDQGDVVMAATISSGNKILKLRDENGIPLWSRRGMKQ